MSFRGAFLLLAFLVALPALGCQSGGSGEENICSADAAPAPYDPAAAAGTLPFMSECDEAQPAQCASGICRFYNHAGKAYCTSACETASDCPCPAVGCNQKKQCKAP